MCVLFLGLAKIDIILELLGLEGALPSTSALEVRQNL